MELHKQHKKEEAIEFIDKSIQFNKERNNLLELVESIYNKGIIYHETCYDIDKALDYFEEALQLYKKVENDEGIGKTLYNIGWTNRDLSNYEKALKYTKENLELQRKIENKEKIARAFVSIGWIYTAQKEYNLAEIEYQKSIELF